MSDQVSSLLGGAEWISALRLASKNFAPASGIDETAVDPVVDDPHADAVSVAELTHVEGSGGDRRTRDAVLVPDPTDHAEGKGLAGRARHVLMSQQCDDLLIVTFG